MTTAIDRRRLNDGDEAMGLSQPETVEELEAYISQLGDGIAALQSLDDLGSEEANNRAWEDARELCRRHTEAKKKLAELKGS